MAATLFLNTYRGLAAGMMTCINVEVDHLRQHNYTDNRRLKQEMTSLPVPSAGGQLTKGVDAGKQRRLS